MSPKYELGDFVQMFLEKGLFKKGCLPNWSEEIWKVFACNIEATTVLMFCWHL